MDRQNAFSLPVLTEEIPEGYELHIKSKEVYPIMMENLSFYQTNPSYYFSKFKETIEEELGILNKCETLFKTLDITF